jgi:hypothetical protein
MPEFSLPDVLTGEPVTSKSLLEGTSVVAFICNHCPFVQHIGEGLASFARYCSEKGVKMVAISSNDVGTYPADAPDKMLEEAQRLGYTFPYLYDESQEVAKAFEAACTPDFFVFDSEGKLAYRGQFDDSRPSNGKPVTGHDLRAAVQALLRGERPAAEQKPSIGCNIKWKRGNAPSYF